jgi:putative flippase GtrA
MQQLVAFACVGIAAAATHLAVVGALVETAAVRPIVANIGGFLVAFLVSFSGHSRWTFPTGPGRLRTARVRFFVVALSSFILNQMAYATALSLAGPRYYLPALAAVLLGVAAATFVLSKLWAFRPQRDVTGGTARR